MARKKEALRWGKLILVSYPISRVRELMVFIDILVAFERCTPIGLVGTSNPLGRHNEERVFEDTDLTSLWPDFPSDGSRQDSGLK